MRHSLGPMLKDKRVRAAMSVDDLANRASLTKGFVSLVENGISCLSPESSMRVAAVLGLDGRQLAARFAMERIPTDLWPALFETLAGELAPAQAGAA